MSKKFYTFRAGQHVPSWMLNWKAKNRSGEFSKGSIKFSQTCLCVRVPRKQTLVIPCSEPSKGDSAIIVNSMHDVNIGAKFGASGVFFVSNECKQDTHRLYEKYSEEN